MTPQTLLVPLDGSTAAMRALPIAEAVARATGATLRLLAVAEPLAEAERDRTSEIRACLAMSALEALERQLHVHARVLQERGVMTAVLMATGDPVAAILAAAAAPDVSAVVMAPREINGGAPQRSVTEAVLRAAIRPVLLAPAPDALASTPARLRTLLLTLDGSAAAEAALPVAAGLAVAARARLLLVRVQQWRTTTLKTYPPTPASDEIQRRLENAALGYLRAIRARLPEPLSVELRVLGGVAADELVRLARHQAADLLVMATHGSGGRRATLGGTAAGVIDAGLPTLLVPPEPWPSPATDGVRASGAVENTSHGTG